MSDFLGANMYHVESSLKDGLYLTLDGGNKADGTKVVTSATKKDDRSSHWAFVYLGIGDSKKEEYHILNRATGTYLTCSGSADNRDPLTCGLSSPWGNIVRWSVVPLRNKTGLYWLVPIKNTKKAIGINGGSTADGAQVIIWDNTSKDKDMHWYLRLVPDAIHNGVDTGVRGP